MSSSNTRESYPDPTPATQQNALPFYQSHQTGQQARQQEHEREEQDGGASEGSDRGEPLHQQEVPDDPQLRRQLTNMMGNYGSGFQPMMQQQSQHHLHHANGASSSALPPGTAPYPPASGAADSAPASAQKTPRTKVSRACDECRRKKIRCDALDETGNTPCSSCARTGSRCAFSRQPMKRGPSKGYIKELAERLNTLERQVHPGQAQHEGLRGEIARVQREMAAVQGLDVGGEFGEPRAGDKRTHAVAEMLQSELPQPGTQQASMMPPNPYYTPPQAQMQSSMQQNPQQQPFWRHGGIENRPEHTALPHDVAENTTAVTTFDWDESVIDEYYRVIHQTFPLLPNSKHRLRQHLTSCPSTLRSAFLAALDCLMRTFPTTTLPPSPNYHPALKKAGELLAQYPFDTPSTHTPATNLVYLQTLLLMALESDNHGPATMNGQAGPSRAEWLGRAAGVAGHLEINTIHSTATSQSIMEGDRDTPDRLARRVWWVLFILDRWHASSTADLLKLPENSVVLLPEDQILLGESTYHLARLSFIIGHLAAILTTTKTPSTDIMASANPASALLALTLAGEIDRFRESVESVWGSLNLVHLSYHHCHLLIKRLSPASSPHEIVSHATKIATVLNSPRTPVTPLNHHFGALAAMTLCELVDVASTRQEALSGLGHLVSALGEGRGLAGRGGSEGWDGAVRALVEGKMEAVERAGGALGQLAMAAGGEGQGGLGQEGGYDPTVLTRYGYLTALGQGKFRSR